MRLRGDRLSILLLVLFLCTDLAAKPSESICRGFSLLWNGGDGVATAKTETEYKELRDSTVASYFTKGGSGEGQALLGHEVNEFLSDFQKFYYSRPTYNPGMAIDRPFMRWWWKHRFTFLNNLYIDPLRDSQDTLSQFLETLGANYSQRDLGRKPVGRFRALFSDLPFETRFFTKIMIVYGIGLSFLFPLYVMVDKPAKNLGERVFGPTRDSFEEWREDPFHNVHGLDDFAEGRQLKTEAENLGRSAPELTSSQLHAKWKKFEEEVAQRHARLNRAYLSVQKKIQRLDALSAKQGGLSPAQTSERQLLLEERSAREKAFQERLQGLKDTFDKEISAAEQIRNLAARPNKNDEEPDLPPELPRPVVGPGRGK